MRNEWLTAREHGMPAATLGVLERCKLVAVDRSASPYRYKPIVENAEKLKFIQRYKSDGGFVSLRLPNEEIGMLCVVNGNKILDAWERPYPWEKADYVLDNASKTWIKIVI